MIFVKNKIFTYKDFKDDYGHLFEDIGLAGLPIPESTKVFTLWSRSDTAFGGVFLGACEGNILPAYHSFFHVDCDSNIHDSPEMFRAIASRFYEELLEALSDFRDCRGKKLVLTQKNDEHMDTVIFGGWEFESLETLSDHMVKVILDLSDSHEFLTYQAA